jgi:hypothetical protein
MKKEMYELSKAEYEKILRKKMKENIEFHMKECIKDEEHFLQKDLKAFLKEKKKRKDGWEIACNDRKILGILDKNNNIIYDRNTISEKILDQCVKILNCYMNYTQGIYSYGELEENKSSFVEDQNIEINGEIVTHTYPYRSGKLT